MLFDPSLVLFAGIPGDQELPYGTPPQFGGFHVRPGHDGAPLSLARVWYQQVPPSSSPPWLPLGRFCPAVRRRRRRKRRVFLCYDTYESSFPLHALKVISVGAIGCRSLGARLRGFEGAGWEPGRWAGVRNPWGREGLALKSPCRNPRCG